MKLRILTSIYKNHYCGKNMTKVFIDNNCAVDMFLNYDVCREVGSIIYTLRLIACMPLQHGICYIRVMYYDVQQVMMYGHC